MYDSRTDKAHSQNGFSSRPCACSWCFPEINRVRSTEERLAVIDSLRDNEGVFVPIEVAQTDLRTFTSATPAKQPIIQHFTPTNAPVTAYEAGRTAMKRTRPGAPTTRRTSVAQPHKAVFVSYGEVKAPVKRERAIKAAPVDTRTPAQIKAAKVEMIADLRARDWLLGLVTMPARESVLV